MTVLVRKAKRRVMTGPQFRAWRHAQGYTLAKLGELFDMTKQSVHELDTGGCSQLHALAMAAIEHGLAPFTPDIENEVGVSATSNVVSLPKGPAPSLVAEQPVVVTVIDVDGSPLLSCPMLPSEDGAAAVVPTDPMEVAFVRAALQHALKQLTGPDADPEIGADYTPA